MDTPKVISDDTRTASADTVVPALLAALKHARDQVARYGYRSDAERYDAVIETVEAGRATTAVHVLCPFCRDTGFDLSGLKLHLVAGWCDAYEATEMP